jgi:hypothetical protein
MVNKLQRAIRTGTIKRQTTADVPTYRAGSLQAQIAELEVNETITKSQLIDEKLSLAKLREALPEMRHELRNSYSVAVNRAKAGSSRDYRVQVFEAQSLEGEWFMIAVIRRTA